MGTALIQGASRGIGLQFCSTLAARGATVIACCRNPSSAHQLKNLQSQHPGLIDIVQLDVTKEADIIDASQYVQKNHKKLDLLFNASGILSPTGKGETSLRDLSFQGLQETFAVNAFGPVMMAKHFSQTLMAGGGVIGGKVADPKQQHTAVFANMSARVGSISDNRLGGWYSYRMSKAALNMATKNLSLELGRGGKKVICIALHPGTVDTDLSRPYHKNVPEGKLFSRQQSVDYLMAIIDRVTFVDTGKYFAWDGSEIPF
ncbi:C-signal-like [Macrobrachium nipponense]|uniref:C-signal-like n=1 Tax=Macrobrachium nipponense TaxID=159736 RepID=UPI0030C89EBA